MRILARLLPLAFFAPLLALAQFGGINTFIERVVQFMNNVLVPLIFAIAFLVFLWGMFQTFILGGGDETKQAEGKQKMMYAIVGFVIMVSLWGIVNLVANGLGFRQENFNNIPNLPTRNN
jgi:hypothetical protein